MSSCVRGVAVATAIALGSTANLLYITSKPHPHGAIEFGRNYMFMQPNQYISVNRRRLVLSTYQKNHHQLSYARLQITWRLWEITYIHVDSDDVVTEFTHCASKY